MRAAVFPISLTRRHLVNRATSQEEGSRRSEGSLVDTLLCECNMACDKELREFEREAFSGHGNDETQATLRVPKTSRI